MPATKKPTVGAQFKVRPFLPSRLKSQGQLLTFVSFFQLFPSIFQAQTNARKRTSEARSTRSRVRGGGHPIPCTYRFALASSSAVFVSPRSTMKEKYEKTDGCFWFIWLQIIKQYVWFVESVSRTSGTGSVKHFLTKMCITFSSYKTSLGILMERMTAANPHFIRCIKPNKEKVPSLFSALFCSTLYLTFRAVR